jgi:hypothetical protein
MADEESREIAREAVPAVARSVANRLILVAVVVGFVALGWMAAGVYAAFHPRPSHRADSIWVDLFSFASIFVPPALPAVWALMTALRARRVGKTAAEDPAFSWCLVGKQLIGVDSNGVPRADRSIRITRGLRAILTAVPRARVISS